MDVRVKATDYELTPEASAYLDGRIAAIEKLLGSDALLARCEVEVGRDAGGMRHSDHMWFAEFNVITPGNGMMRATNRAPSVNAAIDDAQAEVMRQIRREKRLHIRILRRSGAFAKRLMRLG
ncbi:HPF/RaiA family ribosome-associated protein [Candidatus Kaiserbacteria bacterium]|nr:HPF/RaiA family ribosome-associated protein [Candidatus Kaiserbacteria bacterium]